MLLVLALPGLLELLLLVQKKSLPHGLAQHHRHLPHMRQGVLTGRNDIEEAHIQKASWYNQLHEAQVPAVCWLHMSLLQCLAERCCEHTARAARAKAVHPASQGPPSGSAVPTVPAAARDHGSSLQLPGQQLQHFLSAAAPAALAALAQPCWPPSSQATPQLRIL